MYRTLLVFLFLVSGTSFAAVDCDKAVSDPDINECASLEFTKADAELNKVYKQLVAAMRAAEIADPATSEARPHLVKAQRSWLAFREQDCNLIFAIHQTGTERVMLQLSCLTEHTVARTKRLRELLGEF